MNKNLMIVVSHKWKSTLIQVDCDQYIFAMVLSMTPIYFGRFIVTSQAFLLTQHSMALVNLKPLLPGHVLVCPRRTVQRLSGLTPDEVCDLYLTVQRVGIMIERVYEASGLNIAMQDGVDAGQSVPHVHTHIIPRRKADLDDKGGPDAIYGMLEDERGNVGRHQHEMWNARPKFPTVDDASRMPRSESEMAAEAELLAAELDHESISREGNA